MVFILDGHQHSCVLNITDRSCNSALKQKRIDSDRWRRGLCTSTAIPLLLVTSFSLASGFASPSFAQQVSPPVPGVTTIDGDLVVNTGDTLEPGADLQLIVNGNLTLNNDSTFAYDLSNDGLTSTSTVVVNGNVALNGSTLNIGGQPGIGYHRLISYTGSLTQTSGGINIGQVPNTTPYGYAYGIDTSSSRSVDLLVVSNGLNILQTWDGGIQGGNNQDGTWNSSSQNWTNPGASTDSSWGSGYAIFRGLGGQVTIDGAQSAVGLQFAGGNFRIVGNTGSSLNLTGYSGGGTNIDVPEIRVLDNEGAMISAEITGTEGLQKTGDGLLTLWGNNSYSGNTYVNAGILQVASMANLGAASNEIYLNNAMFRTANSFDLTQATHLGGISTINVLLGQQLVSQGGISGDGMLVKDGGGTLVLAGTNSWSGGTFIKDGTLQLEADNYSSVPYNSDFVLTGGVLDLKGTDLSVSSVKGTGGEISINAATLTIAQDSDTTFAGRITGTNSNSNLIKTGTGTLTLSGSNSYRGNTTISGGALAISEASNLGLNLGFSRLEINNNASLVTLADIDLNHQVVLSGSATFDVLTGTTLELSGSLTGSLGTLHKDGSGLLIISGNATHGAGSVVTDGTLQIGDSGTTGTISGNIANNGVLAFDRSNAIAFSSVVSGIGALQQRGLGTLLLDGINTYNGATDAYSGLLAVNGSIASSSLTTIHDSATLGGTGTVGHTFIDGGTLSAGNSIGTLNVAGDLQFTSSSIFHVEVSPLEADRVNVSGQADLGNATVHTIFEPGQYVQKRYTILNAAGGLGGTRFGGEVITDLPDNFVSTLRYDSNNVFLDLEMYASGLNQNQQNVSTALVNYFDATGQLPLAYAGLEANGLTMASGELATAAQQTTVDAMSLFMNTLTEPLITGRSARNTATSGLDTASFEQRWNVWGAAYGGSRSTDGNDIVGSQETRGKVHGISVGADYLISPDTIFGFAIAGGGTSFSLANGLGSGQSDLFQAGIYGRHTAGNAYVTGALSYGWQNIKTNRSVAFFDAEQLNADYNASSWSGRVETGYRFDMPGLSITPFAAGQFVHYDLPAYSETAHFGGDIYALGYSSNRETVGRSELGVSFDKSVALSGGDFNMRTRVAWARNFNNDRDASANILAMPGADFVVHGATQSRGVGRASVSAEMAWHNGLSLGATFTAEFSGSSSNYSGKGKLNYRW